MVGEFKEQGLAVWNIFFSEITLTLFIFQGLEKDRKGFRAHQYYGEKIRKLQEKIFSVM